MRKSGTFKPVFQIALIDKDLNGYFKPLTQDIKILDCEE